MNCVIDNVQYGIWTLADTTGLVVVGNSFDAANKRQSDGGWWRCCYRTCRSRRALKTIVSWVSCSVLC